MTTRIRHVQRVIGTIKGGVEADLAAKTLIVGPNGAGKSAIVNAVELSLVGGASDLEGRAWVQDAKRLGRLADEVATEATISTGELCGFSLTKGRAVHKNGIGASLPYRKVREALTGSAAKAYSFLLLNACASVTKEDVAENVPANLRDRFMQEYAQVSGAPVERLNIIEGLFAQSTRDSKKEAKGAADAVTIAARGMGATVLQSDIDTLVARRGELEQQLAGVQAANRAHQALTRLHELVAAAGALAARIDATPKADPLRAHRANALKTVAEMHLQPEVGHCGICQSVLSKDKLGAYLRQLVAVIDAEPSGSEMIELQRQAATIRGEYDLLAPLAKGAPEAPVSAAALSIQLDAVRSELGDKAGQRGAHAQHERMLEAVSTLDAATIEYKALSDAAKRAVAKLVDANLALFRQSVQAYLGESDRFHLEVSKSTIQFGLLRGDTLVTSLSGAEWARVLTAISCACAHSELPVVIPEERMWDRQTLRDTMVALTAAPCQVILTSTVSPAGRAPKGWKILELEG
jgi:hypothetical protein